MPPLGFTVNLPGGYVYRGLKYSDLLGGNYVFADHSEK